MNTSRLVHDALRHRIDALQRKIHEGMDFALDRLLIQQADYYFQHEEALEELDGLFGRVTAGFDELNDLAALKRFESRLLILEDRCEEIDSALRQRPMRRRARINLFEFFAQSQGGPRPDGPTPEVSSVDEAYRLLGVDVGTRPALITAAFRRLVKELHPDANGGDRSHEPRLRKLVAAYQLIKAQLRG
ncbi:MAG: DnaJ domain-containing protein [Nitrospiria bacterium]